MKSTKSQIELSLQSLLRDQSFEKSDNLTQLLPEANFTSRSQQIKRNMTDFIQNCLANKKLVEEMIERGVKKDTFETKYEKSLAHFSIEVLSGDYGDSYKLFIQGREEKDDMQKSLTLKNESEIEQQIQVEQKPSFSQISQKYSNFIILLQYIKRPIAGLSEISINYFTKIMSIIITNKSEDVYAYFQHQQNNKVPLNNQKQQPSLNQQHEVYPHPNETDLDHLIKLSYYFGGVSEMLAKMVAEEGGANKYIHIKKKVINGVLEMLKNEKNLKGNTNNYNYILDFVSYIFSRTKYRSEDSNDQIGVISQRFVAEDIIFFFKEHLIKSASDSRNVQDNSYFSSQGTINKNQTSRSWKRDIDSKSQNGQQFDALQNIFDNSLSYLRLVVQRMNSQQQIDHYHYMQQQQKSQDPTMNFEVDELLYGQTSLFQLFTLRIPFQYKNISKMWYFQFLLKLTRNSRYKKPNSQKQMGLFSSNLEILIHLLKIFRKHYKQNGLVNLYIEQLISQSILPRIEKLDKKQAARILSALNPSEQVLTKYDDTRSFCQKMILMLSHKFEEFVDHFTKLGIDFDKIRQKLLVKLGGNCSALQNRKTVAKQLQFLQGQEQFLKIPEKQQQSNKKQKSEGIEQNSQIQSENEGDLKQFNTNRQFAYPQSKSSDIPPPQNFIASESSEVEEYVCMQINDMAEQIKIENMQRQKIEDAGDHNNKKQSLMQLLLDSANQSNSDEEQNEVTREPQIVERIQVTNLSVNQL